MSWFHIRLISKIRCLTVNTVDLLTHLSFAQVERPHCVEQSEHAVYLVRGDWPALDDAPEVAAADFARTIPELPGPHGVLAEHQHAGWVFHQVFHMSDDGVHGHRRLRDGHHHALDHLVEFLHAHVGVALLEERLEPCLQLVDG